jgi:D-alanyl-lipoteichoic acid acyltransferase DltB (MBOAT superfamily)
VRLDSAAFLAIFAGFFLLYSAASARAKRVMLLAGSVAFYATLSLRFVPLFLGVGMFTFYVTSRLHRETSESRRSRLRWIGVGANVLPLAFFKGFAPTVHTASGIAAALGLRGSSHILAVALPLGLSFYTLQAISYVVDVDRRLYEPPRSLLSFLASFTLFPHLLSGPIVRSSYLIPQIERVESATWATAKRALVLFVAGLFKKTIADKLAPVADSAFDATFAISPFAAWTGLVAYAGQLYGDFSGYTDMATALALLLGLELPPNFNLPYLATSPADFWRRWHISLSTWLRDYVYLPLGVRFRSRRYSPIVATWLLAGLWHGVSWLFLLYGLYHGLLLAATAWLARRFPSDEPARGFRRLAQTLFTFYLVTMGYVLFRARSAHDALRFFAALHSSRAPSVASRDGIATVAACAAAVVFCHVLDHVVRQRRTAIERDWIVWPAVVVAVTTIVLFGATTQPFIYFAF